jgi:4-diphosphocytidyl-2-C-methyl-D-erythritol kinase
MSEIQGEFAPAKVNLFLHVRGRRPDGKHTLESLVVFPEVGDMLKAEPAEGLGLTLGGPFGIDLGGGEDNLVIRAAEALAAAPASAPVPLSNTGGPTAFPRPGGRPPSGAPRPVEPRGAALHLDKRLPVASGIGGGSTDAAAALRLLARLWGIAPDPAALRRLALDLGADVPVCLGAPAPAMMRGIGEDLAPAPALPECWLVLVNPMRGLSTAAVFEALERRDNPPGPAAPRGFADVGALVAWLARQRNDLEAPARRLLPVVATALGALRWQPTCRLARMSGSGATCFGVFDDEPAATAAAAALRAAEPGWWIAPCRVAGA